MYAFARCTNLEFWDAIVDAEWPEPMRTYVNELWEHSWTYVDPADKKSFISALIDAPNFFDEIFLTDLLP